jgi:hypothetical protein
LSSKATCSHQDILLQMPIKIYHLSPFTYIDHEASWYLLVQPAASFALHEEEDDDNNPKQFYRLLDEEGHVVAIAVCCN